MENLPAHHPSCVKTESSLEVLQATRKAELAA